MTVCLTGNTRLINQCKINGLCLCCFCCHSRAQQSKKSVLWRVLFVVINIFKQIWQPLVCCLYMYAICICHLYATCFNILHVWYTCRFLPFYPEFRFCGESLSLLWYNSFASWLSYIPVLASSAASAILFVQLQQHINCFDTSIQSSRI